MQLLRSLFAVTLLTFTGLAFTGCEEDLTAEKTQWTEASAGWAKKLGDLKTRHAELTQKFQAAAADDVSAAVSAERTAVSTALEAGKASIAEAETAMNKAKTTIEDLIAKGKKLPLEVSMGSTLRTVDGVFSRAESLLVAASGSFEGFTRKVQSARAEADAAKSRAAAWAGEVKKKGGLISIDDLRFEGEAVSPEKSRVALGSLVSTLKACAQLKVDLTVEAAGEAADLGGKRAEALKAYLLQNGIDAKVIGKTVGAAAKEGEEKVALAIATPCP